MVRRDRSHLRLVVNNAPPSANSSMSASSPGEARYFDNTMVREFKGPFAHLRARLVFETFVDWGTWQMVGWTRFSLLDPRTWFYSRLEAVNSLTLRDWDWLEEYTRNIFGDAWHLHHPHRLHQFTA